MTNHIQKGRTPDFLCIGVQKAGTTWFSEMIRQHPDVWVHPVKELQYFNEIHIPAHRTWIARHRLRHAEQKLRYKLEQETLSPKDWATIRMLADITQLDVDDKWYLNSFRGAGPSQICGEATPEYSMLGDGGVAHIKKLAPDAKIILILRDPIERSWSHLRMLNTMEGGAFEIEKAVQFSEIFERVQYHAIIKRWNRIFGKGNLSVEFYDGISADPKGIMEKFCHFLELEFDLRHFKGLDRVVYRGNPTPIPESIYSALRDRLQDTYRENERVFPFMGQKWRKKH